MKKNTENFITVFESYLERLAAEGPLFDEDTRLCKKFGCSQYNACPGGCYWVNDELCSKCIVH